MPDGPLDDLVNQPQRPAGQGPGQLRQGGLDLAGSQVAELDRSESGYGVVGGVPIVGDRARAPARQALGEPILDSKSHRVGGRGADPGVQLAPQRPQLFPDLSLGPAGHLAPDPAPAVGRVAEGDGPLSSGYWRRQSRVNPHRDHGAGPSLPWFDRISLALGLALDEPAAPENWSSTSRDGRI